MAVEDHPLYPEWLEAFELRNEAESRFRKAQMDKSAALEAAKADLDKAQLAYDEVCDRLD